MISELNSLREPIYRRTSIFGHLGRNVSGFIWEKPIASLKGIDRLKTEKSQSPSLKIKDASGSKEDKDLM